MAIAAAVLAAVVSILHSVVAPKRSARIEAEAEAKRVGGGCRLRARPRRTGSQAGTAVIETALGYLDAALRAIDNTALTIALLLLGAIFAAAGGMISARMRLYGALVGAMLINAFVKAEGGSFAAALAAMLAATVSASRSAPRRS